MNRKTRLLILILCLLISLSGCSNYESDKSVTLPEETQMRAICELAAMDCYFNNVARFYEEDAEGILLWKKDKKFWIEYSGIVTIGIDVSFLKITVEDTIVTIVLPPTKILDSSVDPLTLTEDSYIIAENSADITAEDQTQALKEAQEAMIQYASEDTALLASGQEQVKNLLEKYIANIENETEVDYEIIWIYLDDSSVASNTESTSSTDEKEQEISTE